MTNILYLFPLGRPPLPLALPAPNFTATRAGAVTVQDAAKWETWESFTELSSF